MSLYEWLIRRAWAAGDFKLDVPKTSWAEPLTQEAPEGIRQKLRQEMAQIVKREAEALTFTANPEYPDAPTCASGRRSGRDVPQPCDSPIPQISEIGQRNGERPCTRENKMKLAKFVKFREEKFGAVLFETRQEKVYTLNPTGAAVVKEILVGKGDVVQRVKDRYDSPTGNIDSEVNEFLADLKAKGLVTE